MSTIVYQVTRLNRGNHIGMTALVDTHAHIYVHRFDNDRDEMIERAQNQGIRTIIMPAIDIPSIHQAIALCEKHEGLYAMAALHPSETREATEKEFQEIEQLVQNPHVIAVGESGLDYYWDRSFDDQQITAFRRHIQIAMAYDMPLILHIRDKQGRDEVHRDLVRILKEELAVAEEGQALRGIFHCFGGPEWLVQEAEELGFLLGIGGTVTYKNSGVAALVKEIPLSRIVLETDAPYLAPVPYRGKRNEPAYVSHVAEKIAEVKEVDVEVIQETTTQNAYTLFRIPQ